MILLDDGVAHMGLKVRCGGSCYYSFTSPLFSQTQSDAFNVPEDPRSRSTAANNIFFPALKIFKQQQFN